MGIRYQKILIGKDTGEALFTQRNKMCINDEIELLTPGSCGKSFACEGFRNEAGEPILATSHPYMKFYMKVPFEVKEGDILRLKG